MINLAQFTGTMKPAIISSLAILLLTSSAVTSNSCFDGCTGDYARRNQGVTDVSFICRSYLTYKTCSLNCVSGSYAPDREAITNMFQLMDQTGYNCESSCYSSTCTSNYLQNLKLYENSVNGFCRAFTSYETCMKNVCSSNLNNAFQQIKLLLGCNSSGKVQFSLVAIITCIFLALKI